MHHRGGHEAQAVLTKLEHVSLLDLQLMGLDVKAIELAHDLEALCARDELELGKALDKVGDDGAVVRLHVVDHHVVEVPARKHLLEVLHEPVANGRVDAVNEAGLVIQNNVVVVGHTLGHRIAVFKKLDAAIGRADPPCVLTQLTNVMHMRRSFDRGPCGHVSPPQAYVPTRQDEPGLESHERTPRTA